MEVGGEEWCESAETNEAGELYIFGWTRSAKSGNLSEERVTSRNDIIIAKYNSDGIKVWDQRQKGLYINNCWNGVNQIHLLKNQQIMFIGNSCGRALLQVIDECEPSFGNIVCKTDTITLRSKNCENSILWNNNSKQYEIKVNPQETTSYFYTCGVNDVSETIEIIVLEDNVLITANDSQSQKKTAKVSIESSSIINIPATEYVAGKYIVLKPGFSSNNKTFISKIESGCKTNN